MLVAAAAAVFLLRLKLQIIQQIYGSSQSFAILKLIDHNWSLVSTIKSSTQSPSATANRLSILFSTFPLLLTIMDCCSTFFSFPQLLYQRLFFSSLPNLRRPRPPQSKPRDLESKIALKKQQTLRFLNPNFFHSTIRQPKPLLAQNLQQFSQLFRSSSSSSLKHSSSLCFAQQKLLLVHLDLECISLPFAQQIEASLCSGGDKLVKLLDLSRCRCLSLKLRHILEDSDYYKEVEHFLGSQFLKKLPPISIFLPKIDATGGHSSMTKHSEMQFRHEECDKGEDNKNNNAAAAILSNLLDLLDSNLNVLLQIIDEYQGEKNHSDSRRGFDSNLSNKLVKDHYELQVSADCKKFREKTEIIRKELSQEIIELLMKNKNEELQKHLIQ